MWALQKQNLRTKIPEQKFKTTSAKSTEQVSKRKQSSTNKCKVVFAHNFQRLIIYVWTRPMLQKVGSCSGGCVSTPH